MKTLKPTCFVFLMALAACSSSGEGAWDGPQPGERFEAFLLAPIQGDMEAFWESIDPKDRARLLVDYERARASAPGLKPWEMLLVRRLRSVYELRSADPTKPLPATLEPGARVELALEFKDGSSARAPMSWDGSQWFVVVDPSVP